MMKSLSSFLVCVASVVGIGSMVLSVCGQSGTGQGPRRPTDPVQRELQRRFESEAIERALAERPRRPSDHEQRIILAQIKEDFLRIQIIDHDLKERAGREDAIDMKLVARSASEIKRCAVRLQDNLSLPEISAVSDPPKATVDGGPVQLRPLLSSLSKSIDQFVENPLFESARVVDLRLSAQARRDLQRIIDLSKQIKKTSEKLDRAH
jgi:hypothetical protein